MADRMAPAGIGALLAQLEKLKAKLAGEGLFEPERKKPIPFLPTTIGIITSPTGAVIRDILHRLSDRFPRRVILWPVLVQGEYAAGQIARAIAGFNELARRDASRRADRRAGRRLHRRSLGVQRRDRRPRRRRRARSR